MISGRKAKEDRSERARASVERERAGTENGEARMRRTQNEARVMSQVSVRALAAGPNKVPVPSGERHLEQSPRAI